MPNTASSTADKIKEAAAARLKTGAATPSPNVISEAAPPAAVDKNSFFSILKSEMAKGNIKANSVNSKRWLADRIAKINTVSESLILKDSQLTSKSAPLPGRMFFFKYDPKLKNTLPYYDTFPLIIMVESVANGFYGLNLHYLDPVLRAKFMDSLLSLASSRILDEKTKLVLSYKLLNDVSKYKQFKPCFKHYLNAYIESHLKMVSPQDWEIALFLPAQKFVGASASRIWSESRKQFSII